MRAVVRVVAAVALAVACAAPSATAAPVLTGATLLYTDSSGFPPIGPLPVSVQDPGVEFCGPNVACLDSTTFNGVLLDPDSIDFKTSSVVFTLDFNALVDPQNLAGPFWFGVPGATFTLSNFAFDTAAQLVSISSTSSGNLTGATITPNLPLGTVSIDLSNASVATPGQVTITVSLGARETPQPPVPEPTTMLLLGTALVGVVARRRLTQ